MPLVPLDQKRMLRALTLLDQRVTDSARLIIGGGAAMTLAYQRPIAPQDVVDALAAKGGLRMAELDALRHEACARAL